MLKKLNFSIILFILLVLVIASCEKKDDKIPIPKETLYKVLAEIHLAEVSAENETTKMKDSVTKLYYGQIFQKNGITNKDFDSSMSVMSNDPVLMYKVYKQVIEELAKHDPAKQDTVKK